MQLRLSDKIKLSGNALKVLESRYLLRDPKGRLRETPDQLFRRVAHHIAKAEKKYDKRNFTGWEERFYKMMASLEFLPNSPTLMNAGTGLNQLSACFVLPVHDSIDSIFSTLHHTALIQQSGGGTGFNFSELRPSGSFIAATSGESSGPIAFIKVFDAATQHIKQGGKRRGANMGILNVDHPDIEEFIQAKQLDGSLTNFNISVGVTDRFMKAVMKGERWKLRDPNTGKVTKIINATTLWDLIISNAWLSGDPGIIFIDAIQRGNPTPALGKINCTNPCGEVPLLPYEACNLGSINLTRFTDSSSKDLDWPRLKSVIHDAIRFLDDVIEMNSYVIPEIESLVKGNRKVGLGIMGWADLLILLEIPYESEAAIQLAEKIMRFMRKESRAASCSLAKERGVFPNWKKSRFNGKLKMRNATTLSVAPTGSISLIAGVSSSIEPIFALAYKHQNVLNGQELQQVNAKLTEYLKKSRSETQDLLAKVLEQGTLEGMDIPKKIKDLFKTAHEISPEWHLKHQAAFQKYTDNAVSKTINLPQSTTHDDVSKIYQLAWRLKVKGVTVFRDGSRSAQVLVAGQQDQVSGCKVCAG